MATEHDRCSSAQSSPLVSIVMPCRNSGRFVIEALDSISRQTFRDWEIIAVDDGSTDETLTLLRSHAESVGKKMRIVVQGKVGTGAARNAGIAMSSAEYVAFIDSDDIWHPEKLERQLQHLEKHPDMSGISSSYKFFGPSIRSNFFPRTFGWRKKELEDWVLLGRSAPALGSTLLIEKAALQMCEYGFDTSLGSHAEDLDLGWRLSMSSAMCSLNDCLAFIRKSPVQGHRNTQKMCKSIAIFQDKHRLANPNLFSRASKHLETYSSLRMTGESAVSAATRFPLLERPARIFRFVIFRFVSEVSGQIRDLLRYFVPRLSPFFICCR